VSALHIRPAILPFLADPVTKSCISELILTVSSSSQSAHLHSELILTMRISHPHSRLSLTFCSSSQSALFSELILTCASSCICSPCAIFGPCHASCLASVPLVTASVVTKYPLHSSNQSRQRSVQPVEAFHGLILVCDMQNDYPMQTPSPGAFVTPSPSGYSHAAPPALPYRAAPLPRGVVASQVATPSTHPAPSPSQTGASNSQRWKFMDDTGKLRKVSGRLFSEPSATLRWVVPFHPASVHLNLHLHEQHCGVCLHFVLFLMSTAAAGAFS